MNVKEYLNQTLHIDQEIDVMTERLKELRSLSSKTTAAVTDMPSSPTRSTDRLENIVLKIVAQEEAVDAEIDRLVSIRGKVAEMIRGGLEGNERRIMQLRYLCGKTWSDVADTTGLNPRHIRRIHASALKQLDKNFKKDLECPPMSENVP